MQKANKTLTALLLCTAFGAACSSTDETEGDEPVSPMAQADQEEQGENAEHGTVDAASSSQPDASSEQASESSSTSDSSEQDSTNPDSSEANAADQDDNTAQPINSKPTHIPFASERISLKLPLDWEVVKSDSGAICTIQPRNVATSRAIDLYRDGTRMRMDEADLLAFARGYQRSLAASMNQALAANQAGAEGNEDTQPESAPAGFSLATDALQVDGVQDWLRVRMRIEEAAPGTRVQEHWLLLADDGIYTLVTTSRRSDLEGDLKIAQNVVEGAELVSLEERSRLRQELAEAQVCKVAMPPETWGFDAIDNGFMVRPPFQAGQQSPLPSMQVIGIAPQKGDQEARQNLVRVFEEKLKAKYDEGSLQYQRMWRERAGHPSFEVQLTGSLLEQSGPRQELVAVIFGERATWVVSSQSQVAWGEAIDSYALRFLEGFEEREAQK